MRHLKDFHSALKVHVRVCVHMMKTVFLNVLFMSFYIINGRLRIN